MEPAKTLKELLKPPFVLSDDYICDSGGGYLCHAQISLTCVGDTAEIRDGLQQFIVAALNEKWERDFGEPLRWRLGDSFGCDTLNCPYCGIEYRFETLPNWENQLLSSLRTAVIAVKGGTN